MFTAPKVKRLRPGIIVHEALLIRAASRRDTALHDRWIDATRCGRNQRRLEYNLRRRKVPCPRHAEAARLAHTVEPEFGRTALARARAIERQERKFDMAVREQVRLRQRDNRARQRQEAVAIPTGTVIDHTLVVLHREGTAGKNAVYRVRCTICGRESVHRRDKLREGAARCRSAACR